MTRITMAVAVAATVAAAPAAAQQEEQWSWNGSVAAGRTIEIKGVNGEINAVAASGPEIVVRVTKRGRRNDPSDVRMVVVEHAGGVTICALYPDRAGREPNECAPGEGGRNSVQNNDVSVRWEVQVPDGVDLSAHTVNGAIRATNITGTTVAQTVNGSVDVSTAGIARATTVNGSINVTLGSSEWQNDLAFKTTNGSIVIGIAGQLNARVTASTVNGRIETDFPLEVTGRITSRRISGTAGSGGRDLTLQTVNGSIKLEKR